uniref:Uncharacterized protein n=1 Tax=Meloidogyne hapla TaxID=6305 RepID=A0A1I8BIG2_MELHA
MDNDKSQKDSHSSEEKVTNVSLSASTNQPKYSAKDKQKWKMLNPLAAEFNPKRSFESLPQGYDQIHHPNNQIFPVNPPPAFVPQSGQQVIVPPPSLHLHHNGSVPKDQRANFYNNGQNKHYHKNGYNYKREYHSKNNQFPNSKNNIFNK